MLLHQRSLPAPFALISILILSISVAAQTSLNGGQIASVTALDSNKEQDGLVGSVRRVQVETAKLHVRSGKLTEGQRQLLEVTTYDLKGDRLDNVTYPLEGSLVGKEEYKYDEKGNIIEMTVRNYDGSIVSRETYSYEFDKIGNWVKMVSSLVVFEDGRLKNEPVEVTYRTITYYFDDKIAQIVKPTSEQPISASVESRPQVSESPRQGELNGAETGKPIAEQPVEIPETKAKAVPVADSATLSRPLDLTPTTEKTSPAEKPAAEPLAAAPTAESPATSGESSLLELYDVGINHLNSGKPKEAVKAFQGYLKAAPDSAKGYLHLGYSYMKLDKRRDAIKAFKQAIDRNPKLVEAHYLLAVEYLESRNLHDAVKTFKRTLELQPNMAEAHFGLALAYQEQGKTELMYQEYRTLQKLDSKLAQKLESTFPDLGLTPCRSGPLCR